MLVLGVERHALIQVAGQPRPDFVDAVHRKRVANQRAAASAERQPGQLLVLRQIVRDPEIIDVRCRQWCADREATHLLRRRQITLHQRRRHLQHACDVVEPVAHIVGRQQCGDVDVEIEDVANGVPVLGPVETMKRLGATRIETGGSVSIEFGFEPGPVNASCAPFSGRGEPAGGIRPARIFRTTFSHVAASAPTSRQIEPVERDRHRATLFETLGMAGQAVAIQQRLVRVGGWCTGDRGHRGRGSRCRSGGRLVLRSRVRRPPERKGAQTEGGQKGATRAGQHTDSKHHES